MQLTRPICYCPCSGPVPCCVLLPPPSCCACLEACWGVVQQRETKALYGQGEQHVLKYKDVPIIAVEGGGCNTNYSLNNMASSPYTACNTLRVASLFDQPPIAYSLRFYIASFLWHLGCAWLQGTLHTDCTCAAVALFFLTVFLSSPRTCLVPPPLTPEMLRLD